MIPSIIENVWIVDKDIDLTFSPYDDGWYFHLYNQPDHKTKTSKVFKTKSKAMKEYNNDSIVWGTS